MVKQSYRATDISQCASICNTIKGKLTFAALIPSMSRPIPQIRNWCAPGRPLPSASNYSILSIKDETIDPTTGKYLSNTPYNGQYINLDDYLHYNNPSLKVNKGRVSCTDEGTYQENFYSGPGWKSSRIHGFTKNTALPRPIKHWRKQLFPRQYIDQNGIPLPDIPEDSTNIDFTKITRTRPSSKLNIFDIPNGYTITTITMLEQTSLITNGARAFSCLPIAIDDTAIKDINNNTQTCSQNNALTRARGADASAYKSFINLYYNSNKSYLQSRARLNYQVSTFSYNPYDSSSQFKQILYDPQIFPPSTYSLYFNNKSLSSGLFNIEPSNTYTKNCLYKQIITYKPSNPKYQRDYAVQSGSNTKQKARHTINKNQYNITNQLSVNKVNNKCYKKCYRYREPNPILPIEQTLDDLIPELSYWKNL